jgi:hypothetical protein
VVLVGEGEVIMRDSESQQGMLILVLRWWCNSVWAVTVESGEGWQPTSVVFASLFGGGQEQKFRLDIKSFFEAKS